MLQENLSALGTKLQQKRFFGERDYSLKMVNDSLKVDINDVGELTKEALLQCDTRDAVIAFYLRYVKIYDPVSEAFISVKKNVEGQRYIPGDTYEFIPAFDGALRVDSDIFNQFTSEAQAQIKEFNQLIDKIWPKVREWRKKSFSGPVSLKKVNKEILYDINSSGKLTRQNLIKCDTKEKLIAYYLKDVTLSDPVLKNTRIPIKQVDEEYEYSPGDLYDFFSEFNGALDERSAKFQEFTHEAQGQIKEFNKLIDQLWSLVQKWREEPARPS